MIDLPAHPPKRRSLIAIAAIFISAGLAHFIVPDIFVAIMPPYLPAHRALVFISGVFEVLGGLGVLFKATRSYAGYGLLALLLAVFPANLHMALHPKLFPEIPAWTLYLRLPIQFILMGWIWWSTRADSPSTSAAAST